MPMSGKIGRAALTLLALASWAALAQDDREVSISHSVKTEAAVMPSALKTERPTLELSVGNVSEASDGPWQLQISVPKDNTQEDVRVATLSFYSFQPGGGRQPPPGGIAKFTVGLTNEAAQRIRSGKLPLEFRLLNKENASVDDTRFEILCAIVRGPASAENSAEMGAKCPAGVKPKG